MRAAGSGAVYAIPPPLAVLGAKQSVGVFFISFTSFPESKSLRNEAATHRRGGCVVAAMRIQNGFNALFKFYSSFIQQYGFCVVYILIIYRKSLHVKEKIYGTKPFLVMMVTIQTQVILKHPPLVIASEAKQSGIRMSTGLLRSARNDGKRDSPQ
ncbi:MAG: hypothetical protein LBS24_03955 [Clostridiales Family XIII bacterium]|jgi:hypothetical protein|nr:hypothetical protein [Clostridiales Family XIII bacterium]